MDHLVIASEISTIRRNPAPQPGFFFRRLICPILLTRTRCVGGEKISKYRDEVSRCFLRHRILSQYLGPLRAPKFIRGTSVKTAVSQSEASRRCKLSGVGGIELFKPQQMTNCVEAFEHSVGCQICRGNHFWVVK
jgi:hypothetical protein